MICLAFMFRLVLSVHQPTVITALSMVIYIATNKNPNYLLTERSGNGLYSCNTLNADWDDLFDAALRCHKQTVIIQGVHSDWYNIEAGVPHGSVLGPLLFFNYIKDLPTTINTHCFLFAGKSSVS